jgi:hypothetical protein
VSTARVSWWLPRGWAVILALLMLGPALGPGYVLSYDMVWVPDLALRPDFLGVGSGLPRAVPSDAVVATVDEVVPGMLLQKVVLLACLVVGGWGAVHLAPRGSLVGALVAVSVYQWNPFVAERLLIGHWPVLVAYALLPWVIRDARTLRSQQRAPARLWLTVPLGSLSASAGLMTGLVLLAFGLHRGSWRAHVRTGALVLAANAPWLVSGLLHVSDATTSGTGARVFALASAGSVPAPLAALGLVGIWNTEVVLPSRTTVLGIAWLVGLLLLVTLGLRSWLSSWPRRDAVAFGVCWAVGLLAAVATWATPDAAAWMMGNVPGAAVARDGARLLALCAPALTSVAAYGAAAVVGVSGVRVARLGLAVAATLFPLAVLPDAALGLSGRLDAVSYPASYAQTRAAVAERQDAGVEGDVLLLPFSSYRAPDWNGDHKVLDPMGRYLTGDFVANDELSVSSTPVAGEDPRARDVARVLADPDADPAELSRRLASAGIGLVVVERDVPGTSPALDGAVILATDLTDVLELSGARQVEAPAAWKWLMSVAWLLYVGAVVSGVARLGARRARDPIPGRSRAGTETG